MAASVSETMVEAEINYFPPDGPKIFYPGTAGYQRRKFDTRTMQIKDVRSAKEELGLDKTGFELAQNDWTPINADSDEGKIRELVYAETTDFLKRLTGATDVLNFSCLIRRDTAEDVIKAAEGKKDEDALPAAGPTRFAHCDNSEVGAKTVLKDGLKDNTVEYERRLKSRWAIINTWRGLRQVTRDPLAILDARTVGPDDLVGVFSAFPKKGGGAFGSAYDTGEGFETAQVRANDKHQWYYVSQLEPGEALVFKQYDSRKGPARQAPHSAISTRFDKGPTRQSIEVRSLVFWEGQDPE